MMRFVVTGVCAALIGTSGMALAQSGDSISNSAAVYATYQTDVSDVDDRPMASAADIDKALGSLGGHNPDQLSKGFVSYMALVAAQDPTYRKSVREIESYYGRDVLLSGLKNDVRYARTLKGGDTAVGSALTAAAADTRRLSSAGAYVKEQGYSLQSAGWAKTKIGNAKSKAVTLNSSQTSSGVPAKSGLVSALGAVDIDASLAQAGLSSSSSMWDGVTGATTSIRMPSAISSAFVDRKRVKYGKEPVADRIATVAAYRIIGSSSASTSEIQSALVDRDTKSCMHSANLNLQQCVAAANFQYELPFCIGVYALTDVGTCTSVYQ